jgi:hypothetical protein
MDGLIYLLLFTVIVIVWLIVTAPWIFCSVVVGWVVGWMLEYEVPRPVSTFVVAEAFLVGSIFATLEGLPARGDWYWHLAFGIATGVVSSPILFWVSGLTRVRECAVAGVPIRAGVTRRDG